MTSMLIYTEKEVKPKEDIRTSATLEDGMRGTMDRALVRFRLRDVLMPASWVLRSTS